MTKKTKTIKKESTTGLDHVTSDESLTLHSKHSRYLQEYRQKNFDNKEWQKFVNNCKSMIRTSIEYKMFVCYCKTQLGMTNCSFLGHINESENVEIEIHHAILTLHDIVEIVMDDMLRENNSEGISTLEVCNRVMQLHFTGLISVVPLSVTIHQLVHAHKINLHYDQIYGDLIGFIKTFYRSLTDQHIKKIRLFFELSNKSLHSEDLLEVSKIEDQINSEKFTYTDLMELLEGNESNGYKPKELFPERESRSGTRKNKFGRNKKNMKGDNDF